MTPITGNGVRARPTVVHYTDATEFGGAERMIVTLMAGLRAYRWPSILAHRGAPGIRRLMDGAASLGVETRAVPSMQGDGGWLTALRFFREFRRRGPTVFHAHLSSPS